MNRTVSPALVSQADEQAATALRALRCSRPISRRQDADQPIASSCPYCGQEHLVGVVEPCGDGLLSRGRCPSCGTQAMSYSRIHEPLSLPWPVPAMFSSVA